MGQCSHLYAVRPNFRVLSLSPTLIPSTFLVNSPRTSHILLLWLASSQPFPVGCLYILPLSPRVRAIIFYHERISSWLHTAILAPVSERWLVLLGRAVMKALALSTREVPKANLYMLRYVYENWYTNLSTRIKYYTLWILLYLLVFCYPTYVRLKNRCSQSRARLIYAISC